MAYTYDDFVTSANKAGYLKQFGESDLQIARKNPEYGMALLGLYQDKSSATTADQRALADEAINQLRVNYGTLGQINAAQEEINKAGSFSYTGEAALQQAIKDKNEMPEFAYDKEDDPVYRAMRQTARRESERAVADTLARASVGTGGVPSSYAVAAAQQAANNYTGALADAVPTLYQRALGEHQSEMDRRNQAVQDLTADKLTEEKAYAARMNAMYGNLEGLQEQFMKGNDLYRDKLNAFGAAMGTLTDADIAGLTASYPGGVTDVDTWKVLVDRYGEGQLTAAGIKPAGAAAIPEDTMAYLKAAFPGGTVTNDTYWQMLLASGLTEADLNAAGYRKGTAAPAQTTGVNAGGGNKPVYSFLRDAR